MLRCSGLVKPQFNSYRNLDHVLCLSNSCNVANFVARNIRIGCVGWRRHSRLIFLILLFTKPNIEVSGWLYQNKTHVNIVKLVLELILFYEIFSKSIKNASNNFVHYILDINIYILRPIWNIFLKFCINKKKLSFSSANFIIYD